MKQTDPIAESRRYVENARKTLKENGELDVEENRYQDDKYVKSAGNFLWSGVLIALEAVFHVKEGKKRVDINSYRSVIKKRDRKLLGLVNDGYEVMHIYMMYDGCLSKRTCDNGFLIANEIIDKCATMLNGMPAPVA